MFETCRALALMAEEALLALHVINPRASFIIKIRRGALKRPVGKVSRGFKEDCERIVRDTHLRRGTVVGILRGRKTFLKFSRNIPTPHRQRFRNAYHANK